MRNKHTTRLCIISILFLLSIYSDVHAQSGQSSDTLLTESQYVKVLEEIRKIDTKISKLETNLRTHVNEKVAELSKEINEVRSDVAYINGQLSLIKWVVTIIGGPILVGIIILLIGYYIQNSKNKTTVATVNQNTETSDDIISQLDKAIDPKLFLRRDRINKSDII